MKKTASTKKLTILALLSALAIVSFLIESAFPVIFPFMPYAKLGVANFFILFAILVFGFSEGAIVAIVKLALSTMITGNIYGMMYSFCGLCLSFLVLFALFKAPFKTTIVGKSVVSAVCFNVGQIIFASLSLSVSLMSILPLMVVLSTITGGIVGTALFLAIKKLPNGFISV